MNNIVVGDDGCATSLRATGRHFAFVVSLIASVSSLLALYPLLALANPYPEDARAVSAAALAANPDAYIREAIRVKHLRCADIRSDFVCRAAVKSYVVTVDAILLGFLTSDETSSRLAETCKGEAALDLKACEFEALFVPRSSESVYENGVSVVTVKTREIDML